MNNETKRDVFEVAMNHATKSGWVDYSEMMSRYDVALPDNLPVIPKAQSDWIKQCKAYDYSLSFALEDETAPIEVAKTFRVYGGYTDKNKDKWLKLQNTFASAWVLGAWRVEETGEVVKLEARDD